MILSYKKSDGSTAKLRLKTLDSKPITIGRSKNADITIVDGECSRINTAIRYWDDIFIIRDMKSKNGTQVNGKDITVSELNPGDKFTVGETEFQTQSEEGSGADVTIMKK